MEQTSWVSRYAEWALRHRLVILILSLLLALFSAFFFNKIPRDPSVEAMILEDDPDLVAYNRFKEVFGNDEFVLFSIKVPDLFDAQVMRDVEALREEAEKLPLIKEALAYTNLRTIRGTEDSIVVEKLAEEIPDDPEKMALLKKRAMSESDFIGTFYSPDATTMSIVARLRHLAKEEDTTESRVMLTRKCRELVAKEPFNRYTWAIAGVPILKGDLVVTQKRESLKFELMIFLLLAIMVYLILKSATHMALTLGTVFAGIAILMAAHYFSGIPLTVVSTILTPLMMIYGISAAVHIQTHYHLRLGEGLDQRRALTVAVVTTLLPCFFNSATTAVGFGSNLVSSIRPIREFAYFAGGGVLLTFFIAFLVLPGALSYLKPVATQTLAKQESGLRVRFIEALIRLIDRRYKLILLLNVLLLLVSIYGISQIRVETKLLEYFKSDSPIRSSYDFIEKNLSGISAIEVFIDTGREDGMKDPAVLAGLETLSRHISEREPDITSHTSINNFYRRINMALHGDDPTYRRIPQTREEAGQFVFLYSASGPESDLFDFVSSGKGERYRYGRLSGRIRTISSTALSDLVDRIKAKTDASFAGLAEKGVKVNVTGTAVLYANMNNSLIVGQIQSFVLSLVLISIMIFLVAGGIRLGLVSMIPNLMPIAITMGLMGFLDLALDSTTAMIAPIALGMAVDSTIHFMVRFRREALNAPGDYTLARDRSLRTIGLAMLGTSLPLAAGFMVLITSEFTPVAVFGGLSAVVVLLAMFYDLILTPICLWLYKPTYKSRGLISFDE